MFGYNSTFRRIDTAIEKRAVAKTSGQLYTERRLDDCLACVNTGWEWFYPHNHHQSLTELEEHRLHCSSVLTSSAGAFAWAKVYPESSRARLELRLPR